MTTKNSEIFNIKKLFYKRNNEIILNDINLKIYEGDFIAIIGANGAGKSTLVKHFNKINLPYSGEIYFKKKDINLIETFELRKNVSMIFQNPENQIVASIVEEDIAFALENLGLNEVEINKRINYVLNLVNLIQYRNFHSHLLSGGQKQRLAIASILAINPQCLILDEATSMLDPSSRKKILNILKEIHINKKKTIILITHDMEEAAMCSRVIVMNKGRILYDDSPKEIFKKVNELNLLDLEVPLTVKFLHKLKNKININIPINALNINELIYILKSYFTLK